MARPCVYRYVDASTNVVKYVGIVYKSSLERRIVAHMNNDNWANDACWRVEYFECENRSEAEAFESHLIALYETWRYYNKAKCDWGQNRFLPDIEKSWKVAVLPKYDDLETMRLVSFIKDLIRKGKKDEALFWFDFLDFEEKTDGKNWETNN